MYHLFLQNKVQSTATRYRSQQDQRNGLQTFLRHLKFRLVYVSVYPHHAKPADYVPESGHRQYKFFRFGQLPAIYNLFGQQLLQAFDKRQAIQAFFHGALRRFFQRLSQQPDCFLLHQIDFLSSFFFHFYQSGYFLQNSS